jgi:hypothetical protein
MEEMKNAQKILVGKSEGKTLRRRPRRKREDNNIRIILAKQGGRAWRGSLTNSIKGGKFRV